RSRASLGMRPVLCRGGRLSYGVRRVHGSPVCHTPHHPTTEFCCIRCGARRNEGMGASRGNGGAWVTVRRRKVSAQIMKTDRKIIVYIATSADGYIARPDGDVE